MKLKLALISMCLAAAAAPAANAERDIQTWSIQEAMESQDFQDRLGDFRFVWGDSVSGERIRSTTTRKTTNGINKSDRGACEWALLSALIALKEQAESLGGTSVQGIKSTATGTPFSSTTEFQCITGWTNSRVYLEAEIMK